MTTQVKVILLLSIIGGATGLLLLTRGDGGPRGYHVLSVPKSREVLQGLFREADSFEVYTYAWPGKENTPYHLALVRRSDDAKRWATWIKDLDGAKEVRPIGLAPTIRLRFLRGGESLGEVECAPEQTKMAIQLAHKTRAQMEFPSSLHSFLFSFEELRRKASQRASEERDKGPAPAAPEPNPFFVSGPPSKSVEETRTRLSALFRECSFVNITGPLGAGGIDVRTDGKREWEQMTRAVGKAQRGWALPGPAETHILVEHPDRPSMMITLDYDHGVLGAEDPYYGGDVYTLRPDEEFDRALSRLGKLAGARRSGNRGS